MLGRGLLVEEDHDAVICHLLLGQNHALAAVNDEVAEGILWTLSHLLHRHRVILEHTERRPQHHGDLAERDALERLGLLLELGETRAAVGTYLQVNVHKHLGSIGEVADTSLVRQHLLQPTSSLLNPRLQVGDVVEG